jgi:hypothetical protein
MLVSVKTSTFDGILQDQSLLVVFYGSCDLSVLHNQFSLLGTTLYYPIKLASAKISVEGTTSYSLPTGTEK